MKLTCSIISLASVGKGFVICRSSNGIYLHTQTTFDNTINMMMAPFNQHEEGQLVTTLSPHLSPKPHNKHTHCCNHCEYQIWTSNHALIMSCEILHKLYLILAIALRHGYWCHNFPLSKCECNHNITNWNWSKHYYSMFYGIHVVWQLISHFKWSITLHSKTQFCSNIFNHCTWKAVGWNHSSDHKWVKVDEWILKKCPIPPSWAYLIDL